MASSKAGVITGVKTWAGNAILPIIWRHHIMSYMTTLGSFDAGLIDETGRPASRSRSNKG